MVIYPENSNVRLNTGEVGVVVAIPTNFPTRPLIRILFDKCGNFTQEETIVDLLQDLTRFISSVDFH